MKKIFKFQHEKKKYERVIEATKNDIRKYIKRERAKKLPEGMDYWDFECRFGKLSDDAIDINIAQIITSIDKAQSEKWEQCYVEILAKPAKRLIPNKEDGVTENLQSEDGE